MATSEQTQSRSLQLCQLINDRRNDKAVDAEIRRLLNEGVDINIQDLERNKNSPLHLAAKKSDKICVKLLLSYKPNLQIRNGNGKTAIDVARGTEVRELLSSASFDVVRKKFIRTISFQKLSIERLKAEPAFKVLEITCCPYVQVVWEKISSDDFRSAITNLSHLFFIAIETQKKEIEPSVSTILNIKKPIVVQITSKLSKVTKIYHKEENSEQLIETNCNSTISKDGFMQKVHSENFCNFPSLLQALNSNIFGTFRGSLLEVKLNNDRKRREIVNCFAKSSALCHRFFKLFNEKLTNEELNSRVVHALKFAGDRSLLALLDLPFELKDEIELTEDQKGILSFKDSRNYNLLMIAIEHNNVDAVKTLLRYPNDLSHYGHDNNWPSDLCWEKQYCECLAELIKAGSPYPKKFHITFTSCASSISVARINSAIEAATTFHESIQCGDIETIKTFIESNPKLKHVYDRSNKSALTVALESGKPEIYSLLRSEQFTPGVDDEYDEVFKNCSFKGEIRNKNREYFKNVCNEQYLKRLLNKSRLRFSSTNRENFTQVIQKMFHELNEIPGMVPILRIVSYSEHLNIVFDFDCLSIKEMDPTAGSNSKGVVYPSSGYVYVGAKNHCDSFFDVIGTLAHELTHYAMKLTYENDCKPYAVDDIVNQETFESIVNETRMLIRRDKSIDSIISTVFTCYKQEVWHQELIVRVPHLSARYKDEAGNLEKENSKNYRLFDFYQTKVLLDVESKCKILKQNLDIKKINSLTGTLEKIRKHEFQLKKCEIKTEDQIFGSNAAHLTLGMLSQSLDESSHVFINIEQIAYGNMRGKICKLESKDFAIVVDCTEMVKKHEETICKIKQIFESSGKILLVMAAEETSIASSKLTSFKVETMKHVWSDLTEDSKEILLQKRVNFQGIPTVLKDLICKSSAALKELPLNEFYKSEHFKIGDALAAPLHKFYLPRTFITRMPKDGEDKNQLQCETDINTNDLQVKSKPQIEKRVFPSGIRENQGKLYSEKFTTIEISLEELLNESKAETVVIISDYAGTGKTSTLHEIAKNLSQSDPTRWTILVELKKYIDTFKMIRGDLNSFQNFVIQIILSGKPIFEKKLFAQFYKEGRTNILLDGFDEISPHYKPEVLKALKLFTPQSGNRLWITTRSHLELELEKTLDQLSCSLQPLTKELQIQFLENILKSSAMNSQENLAIAAKYLVNKLSSICDSKSSFIGLPILISMLAEIFNDPQKRNAIQPEKFSFYSVFKQFVEKKIDISLEKGEIAEAERKEILKHTESVFEVHSRITIAHFFGNEIADVDVDYDYEQWPVEKLTRFGLIRYDELKNNLTFIHETFAEYFLADFIVGNLKSKTRSCGAVKILVGISTNKDFQVVRLFLNQALKELNFKDDEKLCKNVGKSMVMEVSIFGVMLNISEEACEEVLTFMLRIFRQVEKPIMENIIIWRDEKWDYPWSNILQNIIGNCTKTMVQTIFDFFEQTIELKSAKMLCMARDDEFRNVFHHASYNKNEQIFPTLYECLSKILNSRF